MSFAPSLSKYKRVPEVFRVEPAFAPLLARHRLVDCESLFGTENGVALRRLKTRENWRLDLADARGRVKTLYLKKHRVRTFATRLRARLGLPAPATAARVEAERATQLAAFGVPTMTVAAYAERLRPDGTLVAAFLTEELTGFEQADLFTPRRFSGRTDPALRRLIARVADVAARFHGLGYNHRDFYSCHFFVKESRVEGRGTRGSKTASVPGPLTLVPGPSSDFAVSLIDLQRVQRWRSAWPAAWRRRWVVKDLAQLAYSCPPRLIGPAERMRFFKRYLGVTRLDARGKRLAQAVLRREGHMEGKLGPYRDWDSAAPTVWEKAPGATAAALGRAAG